MPLPLARKMVPATGFGEMISETGKVGQSGADGWSVTPAGPSVSGYEGFPNLWPSMSPAARMRLEGETAEE